MRAPALAAALLLAACSHEPDPQPGGITADDQAQLNDAAAMLDANSVDLNAVTEIDETETATAPEPAPRSTAGNRQDR